MIEVENETPFGVMTFPTVDAEGNEGVTVCVAAHYRLPKPQLNPSAVEVEVAEEQPAPPPADTYWGEPGRSSLRQEAQTALRRPGADIYLTGTAWAHRGRQVKELEVCVRVGPCMSALVAVGSRIWKGLLSRSPSTPRPFASLPLRYEHSFGGPDFAANPVGCGHYSSAKEADGRPLPRIERRDKRIASIRDRPQPMGFGPIARHWEARRRWAGTYDERWQRERAPLWPQDFDVRFFQAAAPGLCLPAPLRGGEAMLLVGLSPDGRFGCTLPRTKLALYPATTHSTHGASRKTPGKGDSTSVLTIDALDINTDRGVFTLYHRLWMPSQGGPIAPWSKALLRQVNP